MWWRVEVASCPRIIAGRAHEACEANSTNEEEAMSVVRIFDDEILPAALDPFPDLFHMYHDVSWLPWRDFDPIVGHVLLWACGPG